jgi:hypothetical protein
MISTRATSEFLVVVVGAGEKEVFILLHNDNQHNEVVFPHAAATEREFHFYAPQLLKLSQIRALLNGEANISGGAD